MEPKQAHAKKEPFWKSKKLITSLMGGFIILIMVTSILGLWAEQKGENKYEYKGIKFTDTDYGWIGYKDSQRITLRNNPSELENISIGYIPVYTLNSLGKVYISLDYNEEALKAMQVFEQNIKISTITVPACVKDTPRCAEMPLKSCEDTTETIGVIMMQKANETEVSLKNNCLKIQGPDLTKIVEKLVLTQL